MASLRDRVTLVIGGLTVLVAVLVIGGALRWTQAVIAFLIAGLVATQLKSRRRPARVSPLLMLLGVAAGMTALQLIPLPDGVLDVIAPVGHGLRADGAAIADTSPWNSISMDPGGTLRGLAFFITLIGVAVACLRVAAAERGKFFLLAGVAVTCGLAAVVTGIHTLFSAESLYGVYKPHHASPPILGPLLNSNHLGGLMAVGAVLSLGLAFYQRQPVQLRVLWLAIATGCVAVAAASQSRGAVLALGIGLLMSALLLVARRLRDDFDDPDRRVRFSHEIPIAIVALIGVGLAVYLSARSVADKLDNTTVAEIDQPLSKFAAWKASATLVDESPWVGVGRGAVEPTLTRVQEASAYYIFSHLENEYVQVVVEFGILGAMLLALALGWCLMKAARRWRDGPLAIAALGALAAIMFQSAVDYGVELHGLAIPVTVIAATLLVVPLRETDHVMRARAGRVGLIVALLLAGCVLLAPLSRSLQEDHDAMVAEVPDADELRRVVERHPLDYLAFGKLSYEQYRAGDPTAVRYLNHALRLHPTHPGLHQLAAWMLLGLKQRSQAAIEYSLAVKGSLNPTLLLTEIVTRLPDVDEAAAAIPLDYANPSTIIRDLAKLKRDDVTQAWLVRIVAQPRHDPQVVDTLYRLALQRKNWDVAEAAARQRLSEAETTSSKLMLAKVLFERKKYDELLKALADVSTWTGLTDEIVEAWLLRCDVLVLKQDWDAATQCLRRLDGSGRLPDTARLSVQQRLQKVAESRVAEAKRRAIEDMERAIQGPKPPPR